MRDNNVEIRLTGNDIHLTSRSYQGIYATKKILLSTVNYQVAIIGACGASDYAVVALSVGFHVNNFRRLFMLRHLLDLI